MSRAHRSAYAKFRCGVAPIRIETGRYERLNYNDRTCFNCTDKTENEQHVLLDCPVYQPLKESLFVKLGIEIPNIMTSTDDENCLKSSAAKIFNAFVILPKSSMIS